MASVFTRRLRAIRERAANTTIWAWGDNEHGQLGDGTDIARLTPVRAADAGQVRAIEAGAHSVFVLRTDGTVWAWGSNANGELGNGTTASSATGAKVVGLSDVRSVVAAFDSTYALKGDGTVWAWGDNSAYQLGDGTTSQSTVPVLVRGLDGVVGIAAAGPTAYALKRDGSVWAWGYNATTECGVAGAGVWPAPVQVGSLRADVLVMDGERIVERLPGLPPIQAVCAGRFSGYGLGVDGTVWAWGGNESGQLGTGENRPSMLSQLDMLTAVSIEQVRGLEDVVAISSKGNTAYALRRDGTVWAWGDNTYGSLGAGHVKDGRGGTMSTRPVQVAGLTNVKAIASSGDSAYALKHDGTVWAWGENEFGELGDGTLNNRSIPVKVHGLGGVTAISAGIISAYATSM